MRLVQSLWYAAVNCLEGYHARVYQTRWLTVPGKSCQPLREGNHIQAARLNAARFNRFLPPMQTRHLTWTLVRLHASPVKSTGPFRWHRLGQAGLMPRNRPPE
jgi:hypothetical protein